MRPHRIATRVDLPVHKRTAFLLAAAFLSVVAPVRGQIHEKALVDREVANPADWYECTVVPPDPAFCPGEPGLYPGGQNVPSGAHAACGSRRAAEVVPLLPPAGSTAPAAPAIGVVALGMSNTNQEWARFERDADAAAEHAARVVLVDLAQGGVDAARMADPGDIYWTLAFQPRLAAAGIDPAQVQVAWIKQSIGPESWNPPQVFPEKADVLRGHLATIVGLLRARLPALRLIFFSSRIFGGYAGSEPFAFETAFAVKGLVGEQITDTLGWQGAPWLGWGPYLWADGPLARADGLVWAIGDVESGDHLHPSLAGETKVAQLLRSFLASDARAASWYAPPGFTPPLVVAASADATVDSAQPSTPLGANGLLALSRVLPSGTERRVYLEFPLDGVSGPIERAKLSLLADATTGAPDGRVEVGDPTVAWNEMSITWDNRPPTTGGTLRTIPSHSRGGALAVDVTSAVQAALAAGRTAITFVLIPNGGGVWGPGYLSREAGEPPRLLLAPAGGSLAPALAADGFEDRPFCGWTRVAP